MQEHEENTPEPTLVDLAKQLDLEGMVGFTQTFHEDLRDGFEAVNVERFPWLEELKKAPERCYLFGYGGQRCRWGLFVCIDRSRRTLPGCGSSRLHAPGLV